MKKLLAPISLALGFLGVVLAGFLVSANAASVAAPDDGNLLDLARPVFDEIMKGHYIAAASLALILSVALVKRYAPGKFGDFVHSDAGGSLTTLLMSFGGALATATMGGAAWTWGMLPAAGKVAFFAAGGYVLLKKLIVEPFLKPLSMKTPAWMAPLWGLLFFAFDRKVSEKDAIDGAKLAGATAVLASPATGADGVVGPAKDL
jgi:hypothetical protein